MYPLAKYLLYTTGIVLLAIAAAWLPANPALWQPAAVVLALALAIGLRFVPALKGFQFTAWIIAAVTAAMIYPNAFLRWGQLDLRDKWIILVVVQAVMFGQ